MQVNVIMLTFRLIVEDNFVLVQLPGEAKDVDGKYRDAQEKRTKPDPLYRTVRGRTYSIVHDGVIYPVDGLATDCRIDRLRGVQSLKTTAATGKESSSKKGKVD